MTEVKIDLSGFDRIMQTHPQRVERWLDGFAEDIRTRIVNSFNTSPPGRRYTRRTVTHVASQPGNPPNIDTGTLANSIRVARDGRFRRLIQDGVEYGIYLEHGTERIQPRPFMSPVMRDAGQRIKADAKKNLKIGE